MEKTSFIIWNASFSVGVALMDEQHQFLINLINDLYNETQHSIQEKNASVILDQMIKYSKFHFSAEEDLLQKIKYPRIDEQILEHREYFIKVLDFQAQLSVSNKIFDLEVLDFLKKWWLGHIQKHDMLYKPFFIQ